jgi:hypothetical protein
MKVMLNIQNITTRTTLFDSCCQEEETPLLIASSVQQQGERVKRSVRFTTKGGPSLFIYQKSCMNLVDDSQLVNGHEREGQMENSAIPFCGA